ncbi:MAG: 3-dehydroquinate synthase II [Candidatus Poseidoniaceae archaeon]|nr:3-dehydroquinate synthase II [Candidatus Poseidoniaceae archaeon]
MEIWLDVRTHSNGAAPVHEGVDRLIDGTESYVDGSKLYLDKNMVGAAIHVTDSQDQEKAKSLIGSVGWLMVSFESWSMIPLENLIAANEGTPTRIAAVMTTSAQIQGAAFALQQGVDAIVIPDELSMLEAACIAKAQRLERHGENPAAPENDATPLSLSKLKIKSIEEGGIGERYCIDFTSMLELGEGMLVGSNASSFMLVHGETVPSEFVPSRPFRVNAGSPQSYALMADGTTKYLAELNSGDRVTIASKQGMTRQLVIGRLKIEQRPLLLFRWVDENDKEGHMFLQQAETVRAVDTSGNPVSVTSLRTDDQILGWDDDGARHIGVTISSIVSER